MLRKPAYLDPQCFHEKDNFLVQQDKACADPGSFVKGGPILTFCFLVGEGRMDHKIPLKAGHHRPTSETPLNGVSLAC